jgi:hypothetical protein
MAEGSSHAPGSASDFGAGIRQRHMMGEGDGPMKGGDFGVSEYPGKRKLSIEADSNKILADAERAQVPTAMAGKRRMGRQGEIDHGPHMHHEAMPT